MKFVFLILISFLFGCKNSKTKSDDNSSLDLTRESHSLNVKVESSGHNESNQTVSLESLCKPLDFLKLREKEIQVKFLHLIDSIKELQYPEESEPTTFVDITQQYLINFLNDLNIDSLRINGFFEKEYDFNKKSQNTDQVICQDAISVAYLEKDCSFMLHVLNTNFIDGWCGESSVVYLFKIKNDKVIDFIRREAG